MMLSIIECDAGIRNAPDKIEKTFNQQYPQSKLKKWENKNNTWIADFAQGKRKNMAYYSPDGQWIKTETKIPWTKDLPVQVDNSWKYSVFASWYVAGIKEVKYPDKPDRYVVKVQENYGPDGSNPDDCEDVYKLYFSPDGKLIQKVYVSQ